jgi:hypothetical protein
MSIQSPLIATSEQQKLNEPRKPEKEYVEIWDESGSLIGVISPSAPGFAEWREKKKMKHGPD